MSKEDLFTGSGEEFVSLMDKEWSRTNEEKEKIEQERQRLIETVDWPNAIK